MKLDPFDILAPGIIALVFLALGWISSRSIAGGGPLSSEMRKGLFYGFFFVLGMGYSMAVVAMFGWPRFLWIVFTVAWALLLASIAWWRYRQTRTEVETPHKPVSAVLAEGIPALGLLICVIAGERRVKKIPGACRSQKRHEAITTEGYEMEVAESVVAF